MVGSGGSIGMTRIKILGVLVGVGALILGIAAWRSQNK